jgi:hypothetical protein
VSHVLQLDDLLGMTRRELRLLLEDTRELVLIAEDSGVLRNEVLAYRRVGPALIARIERALQLTRSRRTRR